MAGRPGVTEVRHLYGNGGIELLRSPRSPLPPLTRGPAARSPESQPRVTGPVLLTQEPAVVNLALYRGDDFGFSLTVSGEDGEPYDVTGYTVRAQVRATRGDPDVAGELAPETDGHQILLHLTHAVSAGLPAAGQWDCEIASPDEQPWVTTVASGSITLVPDVTR